MANPKEKLKLRKRFSYKKIKVNIFPHKQIDLKERKKITFFSCGYIHYFLKDFITNNEFYKFLNDFKGNEHKLLSFYLNCQFYHYGEALLKEKEYALRTLILIFIIEGIIHPEYWDFYQWLCKENKDISKQNLEELHEEYLNSFGSLRTIVKFFNENLSRDEKLELLTSYQFKEESEENNNLQHVCFQECKAISDNMLNDYDEINCLKRRKCPLELDDVKLSDYLKNLIRRFTEMSNNVVHKGQLVMITSGFEDCLCQIDAYFSERSKLPLKYQTYSSSMKTPRFSYLVRKACYNFLRNQLKI